MGESHICVSSQHRFDAFFRIASWSVAEPPGFATLVDAFEDEDSFTLVFDVGARRPADLHLQVTDQVVTLWGPPRSSRKPPMNRCALPSPITPELVGTRRSGELLRVRAPKSRRSE